MPTVDNRGVHIHYELAGDGQPVILVHGFASSIARNWGNTGWLEFLSANGFRAVGVDVRGHGQSDKLYDPAQYAADAMAGDVLAVMDDLQLAQADLMGYSMGAGIALYLLLHEPQRFRRVVLGGIGDAAVGARLGSVRPDHVARALETDNPESIADPVARRFRGFAERSQNDLRALAAVMRRPHAPGEPARVRRIDQPVLVVVGANDDLAGGATHLSELIPGARLVVVPDRDHLTVVADPRFKEAVLEFLKA